MEPARQQRSILITPARGAPVRTGLTMPRGKGIALLPDPQHSRQRGEHIHIQHTQWQSGPLTPAGHTSMPPALVSH